MPQAIIHSRRLSKQDNPEPVLEDLLNSLGGLEGRVNPGSLVLIKPNFVAPFPVATTDLTFIDFFIRKIREINAVPIVGETSGYEFDTDMTLKILGVCSFLEERGVEMVNFEKSDFQCIDIGKGIPTLEVADVAVRAELIINLPVLKGHTITKITGAAKNFFGLLSKRCRRSLHCQHLHNGIAALARNFPNSLHFVDAREFLSRAVFGETKPLNYCLSGTDPFALDYFGSKLLSVKPGSVRHLKYVPDFIIQGTAPKEFSCLEEKESIKDRFHRAMYSAFYWLDELNNRVLGGKSIIPSLHWTLGLHPTLRNASHEELVFLSNLCPVDAISIENKQIIKEKCIKIRCMKCYNEGPPGTIILKGLNPPRRINKY